MSFSDNPRLEAQPTTYRLSDDARYRDDPDYDTLTTTLSDKLFNLTTNINTLSRQVELLGTRRETERVRERVQDLIEETGNGFKDIGDGLKKAGTWPDLGPHQRYTQNKLNTDFRSSLGEFQLLSRRAIEKQRASKTALEADQQTASWEPGTGGQQLQQQQQQQQQQEQIRLADQSEVEFQENLIIERESEIRQIEQSVGELNELFRDVATMVHEQGFVVDSIEQNVEGVREDTRGADLELRTASRYQKSARGRACCLLLILAVVLVIIVLAGVYG